MVLRAKLYLVKNMCLTRQLCHTREEVNKTTGTVELRMHTQYLFHPRRIRIAMLKKGDPFILDKPSIGDTPWAIMA